MIEFLNWYAEHYIVGSILLYFIISFTEVIVNGVIINGYKFMLNAFKMVIEEENKRE